MAGSRPTVDINFVNSMIESSYKAITIPILCDIRTLFDDISILKRESASDSIQAFAEITKTSQLDVLVKYMKKSKHRKVFIKINLVYNDRNTMLIEKTVYRVIRNLILNQQRSSNFVRYIMSSHCDDFIGWVAREKRKSENPLIPASNLLGK